MVNRIELAFGESTQIEIKDYLRVRLIGDTDRVGLRKSSRGGEETANQSGSSAKLELMPVSENGPTRITITPSQGTEFEPGKRVGLEIQSPAKGDATAQQILISQRDVGHLISVDLAVCEYDDAGTWTISSPGSQTAGPFPSFFSEGVSSAGGLDEREYPWILQGRYAVRQARKNGSFSVSSVGDKWALLLDSSASIRTTVTPDLLARAVEFMAGIFAESTGNLPMDVAMSGTAQTEYFPDFVTDPGQIVDVLFTSPRPASWLLTADATRTWFERGATAIAIVSDSLPSDFSILEKLLRNAPTLKVAILILESSTAILGTAVGDGSTRESPFGFGTVEGSLVRVAQLHPQVLSGDMDDSQVAAASILIGESS